MSKLKGLAVVGLLAIAALMIVTPAGAQEYIINEGVDLFNTAATGMTFVSFAADPIPAEFFCPGSPPFDGRIELEGVPLVTDPPGIAYNTDTIVEHLEAVSLEPGGVAQAPIRMVAMTLKNVEPIMVECDWGEMQVDLQVCLARDEEQPVTMIEIMETSDEGGVFTGDLIVIADLFFYMEGQMIADPIRQHIDMYVLESNRWMYAPGIGGFEIHDWFMVDTDCDGKVDREVPGTSNFFPGWNPDMHDCFSKTPEDDGCHENPNGEHAHCPGTPCVENAAT